MKKLMIGLAFAALAAGSQAASVSWAMGSGIKPDGEVNAASGTLNMYVWVFDAANKTTWDAATAGNIWSTYGNATISQISGFTSSVTGKGGSTGGSAKTDPIAYSTTESTPYYAVVITTYDSDKDGAVDMYAVNKSEISINTSGTPVGSGNKNLSLSWGGTGGSALTWQAVAVPEPTSGLLLLLGVAGLALRRRRA